MIKNILIIFLISISLTACTSIAYDVSPRQSYRPANSEELWDVSGSVETEWDQILGVIKSRVLSVYINDERVIYGALSANATGELSGQYKDHKVHSICASELKTPTWLDVRCTILIDNERATTLTF